MRCIVIIVAAAAACALASAGTAAAASTPQSPQSATYLISCPGIAPFLATSPTPPSAAGIGTPMAVIPQGQFHGPGGPPVAEPAHDQQRIASCRQFDRAATDLGDTAQNTRSCAARQ